MLSQAKICRRFSWLFGFLFPALSFVYGQNCEVKEGAEDCNQNGIADACEVVPVSLQMAHFFDVRMPRQVYAADLNGDGAPDIVVTSVDLREEPPYRIWVFLHEADGSFSSPARFDGGQELQNLAFADAEGDGDLDVFAVHRDFFSVLLNDGRGRLSPSNSYSGVGGAHVIALGDISGDGRPDVVVSNNPSRSDGGSVSFFENVGDGTFRDRIDFVVGGSPRSVNVIDLDVDGDVDVVTLNRASRDLSILDNDGGSLAEASSYSYAAPEQPSFTGDGLVAGDLDGDGATDLIVRGGTHMAVLLNRNDGTIGFRDPMTYTVSSGSALVSDFDADGDLDYFQQSRADLTIKFNDGDGGFATTRTFNLVLSVPGIGLPGRWTTGDFDRDGDPDIAAVTATRVVLLWNTDAGSTVRLVPETIPLSGCLPPGCRPHAGVVADLDGDGNMDFISSNTHPGSFSTAMNDGQGNLVLLGAHSFGGFGGTHPVSVAAGDFDEDGNVDLITPDDFDGKTSFHGGNGDGTFQPPTVVAVGDADLTRGGMRGSGPIGAQVADFDRDGHLDVAIANRATNSVSVLFNDGDAVFDFRDLGPYGVGAQPTSLAIADFDGDGSPDIAAGSSVSSGVKVLLNDGSGNFGEKLPTGFRTQGVAYHVAAGDFDNDEDEDLVTASVSGNSVSVFLNDGLGTFGDALSIGINRTPYSVIVTDLNADGNLDLVTANERQSSVTYLEGAGDGTFAIRNHINAGRGLRYVFAFDIEPDGDLDLVTTDREGQSFTVLRHERGQEVEDYLGKICTPAEYHRMSVVANTCVQNERFLKYVAPARNDPALLHPIYQNSQRYRLHQEFLGTVFGDRFPGLGAEEYNNLVGRRETRDYFIGSITGRLTDEGLIFTFTMFADTASSPSERVTLTEVQAVYRLLFDTFNLDVLAYQPGDREDAQIAAAWENPGFPIYFGENRVEAEDDYEAYTQSIGFGRVRILSQREFEMANDSGEFGFQDILVLERAPRDIEGVLSGVITAERQGELSHVAVRTARRGTPNAFIGDALEAFAPFEGKLIRLEVRAGGYTAEEAGESAAAEWWEVSRPQLSVLPSVDEGFAGVATFEEIVAMHSAGVAVESRFGGKASNLARLQGILPPESSYRLDGFGIPVRHYLEFLRSNSIESLVRPGAQVTYEDYLREIFADPEFQTNSKYRFEALRTLRDHMEDEGEVDENLISSLVLKILDVFGNTDSRVRFRSSSNVEDALEFNGAGLYDSTSVCTADDLDADDFGPSQCQAFKNNERGVARGLKRVWSSLWNFGAHEERAFFGIPRESVAMGVLVNPAFVDEQVNGVAFTGNPSSRADDRYVVVAQLGEHSVVSPEPGVLAEKNVLEVAEDGRVERIIRSRGSTLVPDGTELLSDEQLEELGALMWHIDRNLPIELGDYDRSDMLLDLEFKIEADGDLAVKQVRPFLRTESSGGRTFELVVPDQTTVCGVFLPLREPRVEYELKSQITLRPGRVPLPTASEVFAGDLFTEVLIGPELERAEPLGGGLFRVVELEGVGGEPTFGFDYAQDFALSGDRTLRLELVLDFGFGCGESVEPTRSLDEEFLVDGLTLGGQLRDGDKLSGLVYSSCTYESLPLFDVFFELEDGTSVRLEERFREDTRDTGPANIFRAELHLGGTDRVETEYTRLVYAAARHNEAVHYWVVLDPPVTVEGVDGEVFVVEFRPVDPRVGVIAHGNYLGADFEVLARVEASSFEKEIRQTAGFRRGEVVADNTAGIDVDDAMGLLVYLFRSGKPPGCDKAADANDDGALNLGDVITILLYVFQGESLPAPFSSCGSDPTSDALTCQSFPLCE